MLTTGIRQISFGPTKKISLYELAQILNIYANLYCYMFCFDYISCKEICCQIK